MINVLGASYSYTKRAKTRKCEKIKIAKTQKEQNMQKEQQNKQEQKVLKTSAPRVNFMFSKYPKISIFSQKHYLLTT